MPVRSSRSKNAAAVALGRKGGEKGGPARAAKLTAKQRSESARKAVQARWARTQQRHETAAPASGAETDPINTDTSDRAVLKLLRRIKAANNSKEVRRLSDQLERAIFHKQYASS